MTVTVVLDSSSGSKFTEQASPLLAPVLAQDKVATTAVAGIGAATAKTELRDAFETASQTLATAQAKIDLLTVEGDDATLRNQVIALLVAERQWMNKSATTVMSPTDQASTQIVTLGETVAAKRLALAAAFPELQAASFPSSNKLSAYVHTRVVALGGRAATVRFINDLQSLLNQSATSFALVNHFYSQLYAVNHGGEADFTTSQAEAEIAQIIDARANLETSARNLTTPNPKSQVVADRLVEAFSASLANDNALSDCLYQGQTDYGTFIDAQCVSSTTVESGLASAAKASFVSAFNDLRASVGLPAVQPRF